MSGFMKKIAHRGISAQAPENTRSAFEKMITLGVDWLETDIDITSDGELVLIHDNKVDRTSDSSGSVNDMSLRDLQKLDFGRWFGEEFTGERIVTLDWLIDFINQQQINVNFELKTDVKGDKQQFYLTHVCQALRRVSTKVEMIVSSFDVNMLKKFHALMPEVVIGVLVENQLPDNLVAIAKSVGASYVHPDGDYLTKEQTQELIDNHLQINVWTVNDSVMADKLQRWHIQAVFTDFPKVTLL